jgi:hypothetical protein
MPIGGVSINEAVLTYGFSRRAARASSPGTRTLPGQPAKTAIVPRFTGRLAQTSGSRSADGSVMTDANIHIEIKLKQMDLPQGVLDLLQHTQGGIVDPVDKPKIEDGATTGGGGAPGTDRLFTAEILDTSAKVIQPGERFVLKTRITPRSGLSKPLHVSLSSQPGEALNILEPTADFDLTSARDIELVVFVSNAVKDYKPDTRVSITVRGTSYDKTGSPLELVTSLDLPRL